MGYFQDMDHVPRVHAETRGDITVTYFTFGNSFFAEAVGGCLDFYLSIYGSFKDSIHFV